MAESKRIDLCFQPDVAKTAARESLGALGRMTTERCALEGFHNPPGLFAALRCVAKQLLWRERLERDAERAARKESGDTSPNGTVTSVMDDIRRRPPIHTPGHGLPTDDGLASWILRECSGASVSHRDSFGASGNDRHVGAAFDGHEGHSASSDAELRTHRHEEPWKHLVEQLTELGNVFSQMVQTPTTEEEDFMAEARKLVREIEEEAYEKGVQKGIQKGQKSLLRDLIESRLERSLTSEEITSFRAHFNALGAIALGVHIGGLDAVALAAWLAHPPQS